MDIEVVGTNRMQSVNYLADFAALLEMSRFGGHYFEAHAGNPPLKPGCRNHLAIVISIR